MLTHVKKPGGQFSLALRSKTNKMPLLFNFGHVLPMKNKGLTDNQIKRHLK